MDTRFASNAYRYFFIWGICASLATTVCTIVDALLVGNLIGNHGLAVANLSTPVFLLYALVGITLGVGANVQIGRKLGAADIPGANRIFHSLLTAGLVIGGVLLLPLLVKKAYFSFLGVTPELYPLAERYLTVVMWSAPVFVLYHILSASVRTDSNPRLSAIASAVVILTNLSLDILFMQVLGWGIVGASASLCIAESLGTLVLLTHFFRKRALLKWRLCLPGAKDVWQFVVNGFGIGSANIFLAVVMLVFNGLLLRFGGDTGALYVAVYGVIYTVSTIPLAIFDGASNALSTVTSYFLGESDTHSALSVLRKALVTVVLSGSVLAVACGCCAELLLRFFGIVDELPTAVWALGIFAVSIPLAGVNMVVTAYWQVVGRAKLASGFSAVRNCLVLLLAGIVLIPGGGIRGLGAAYICCEGLCLLFALTVLLLRSSKKYVLAHYSPSGRTFEENYPIQTQSMEKISADLEQLCDRWDIGMKQAFFINLICEELLLNIIKFGISHEHKNYYISIRLMEKDGDYVLRIRDNVHLYNPFESSGDHIDSGILKLIRMKTKYCDYQRKMIFNYLYMII